MGDTERAGCQGKAHQGADAGAERVTADSAEGPDDAPRLGADAGADGPGSDGRREPDAAVPDVNSLVVADLDGDGILDIAATTMYAFVVALGVGDGTFKPKQDFPGGNITASIVAHDFNGDGRPDLTFTDSGANTVRVMLSGSAAVACR
jgi:hypothetical protein